MGAKRAPKNFSVDGRKQHRKLFKSHLIYIKEEEKVK